MCFPIENNHMNNASSLIGAPIHVFFYKNMYKRIPFVSLLIGGRVTEKSYV